jgi:uncharacterized protein
VSERVLIAGGTGLLGRALAAKLAGSGRDVVLLSRSPAGKAQDQLPPGCRLAAWDARTADGWLELAEGARAIVNLAGESIGDGRWSAARKERILSSRLQATAAVVEAIGRAKTPPPVLVQASGVGIYGERGDEALAEGAEVTAASDDFLAQTARSWEAASAGAENYGVRRVVVRTGLVLAREGGALPRMALPFRFGLGAVLGSGRQWMPWIHVEDWVAALELVLENAEAHGTIHFAAPEPARQGDFARELARTLHRPCLLRVPAWALRAGLGEMSELVLDSQRIVPQRLLDLGFRFRFPRLPAALADLFHGPRLASR